MALSHEAIKTLFPGKTRLLCCCFALPYDIVCKNVFQNMFQACFVFSACSILSKHVLILSQWTTPYTSCDFWLNILSTKMAKTTAVMAHINWKKYWHPDWFFRAIPLCRMRGPVNIGIRISSQLLWLRFELISRLDIVSPLMPRGGYSRQTPRLFWKTSFACVTSLFSSKTRVFSNVSKNSVFRASCDIAFRTLKTKIRKREESNPTRKDETRWDQMRWDQKSPASGH